MKPFNHIICLLFFVSLLSISVLEARASWTVLVYGHADHNLTSAMRDDLLEMEQAGSSEDFNIVVQVDINTKNRGTKLWKIKNKIDPKKYNGVNRLLIGEDTDGRKVTFHSKIIESLSESNNMDDPAVLRDFIKWGMAKYPADRYGLVLWNHGGQFLGYGGDTQNASLKHGQGLTTQQIRSTITEALTGTGVNKFEFVGFDTCLMGGAEVLDDFSTLCDVFIACPELDFGDGWDYAATLNYLKANSEADMKTFGRQEVGFWNAHHGEAMDQTHKVHAAYDMEKYDAFALSFKAFSEQLKLYGLADGDIIPKLRAEATHYSISNRSQTKSPTHFIDLGDFAKKLANAPVNADLKNASLNLVQSIDDMVLAKSTGSMRTHVSALSITYPYNTENWVEHYEKKYDAISFTQGIGVNWRQFLGLYGAMSLADQAAPVLLAGDNSRSYSTAGRSPNAPGAVFMNASLEEPAVLDFSVLGKDVFELSTTLVVPDNPDNPNEYIYIGEVGRFKVEQEGNYEMRWPGTNSMITSAEADYMLRMGGWFMDREAKQMISFADYQPPESDEVIQLFLFTTIDEEGLGKVHTILEDSGQELPDGGAVAATPASSSLELEVGGKLWPVFYSEIWVEADDSWQNQYLFDPDGYFFIPENGVEGIEIEFTQEIEGRYSLELQASDFMGNFSKVLEYNVDVPADKPDDPVANQYVSTLEFTGKNQAGLAPLIAGVDPEFPGWIYILWADDGAVEATLQQTDSLSSAEWVDVPSELIDSEDNDRFHWAETASGSRFFRLIKH
ncbi:MAG: clostripain-related cysteine peptidase [Verrucomicrobiota bacterium]|nr:clostripain-related cysteine peptidase [Verrucomicrobiota bacterium]